MLCFMWKLILALKKLSALIVGFVWKFPENHLKWIYSISIWSCSAKQDSTLMRPGVSPWDLGMKITRSLVVLASKCTRFGAPPWERLNGPRPGPGRKGAAKCSAEAPGDATPRFCGRLVGKCWKSGLDFHGAFKRPPKTGECFCLFHFVPHQVGRCWLCVVNVL